MNTPTLRHIHLAETDSTNRYAREHTSDTAITLISTDHQTAGRGQRGNSWESAAGKNLLFSLIAKPKGVPASQQFALSELISVALCDVLSRYTTDIRIKWPNDIYHKDRKLCGILIEHDLEGTRLTRSLIGVGVNVNQTCFTSDAPNPTSLALILGHEVEREALLRAIAHRFAELYTQYTSSTIGHALPTPESAERQSIEAISLSPMLDRASLHARYTSLLYRRDTVATYRDAKGTFTATLRDVAPDGRLLLEDRQGTARNYLFKEVAFVLRQQGCR